MLNAQRLSTLDSGGAFMAADSKPKIDRAMQDRIGQELRAMYEDLLKQPLPEKLTAPLRALNEVQSSQDGLNDAIEAMRRSITLSNDEGHTPEPRKRA
jgi:hypothetical protein